MAIIYDFPKIFTPSEVEAMRKGLAAQGIDAELSSKIIEELRAVIGQTRNTGESKTLDFNVPAEFAELPGSQQIVQEVFNKALWLATRRFAPVILGFTQMTIRALVAENELQNKG